MWEPFARPDGIERIVLHTQTAPPISGVQPWGLCIRANDRIELGFWNSPAEQEREHPVGPGVTRQLERAEREFVVSCGAALYNLRLAFRVAGHNDAVWLLPDPERDPMLLASVEIVTGRVKPPSSREQELYEAIGRCYGAVADEAAAPVPLPVFVAMERAAAREGGWLRLLHRQQAEAWLRRCAEGSGTAEPDMMPNAWAGQSRWLPQAGAAHRSGRHQPQLMTLSTDDDRPLDWLRAGQALQAALLTGARYLLSASGTGGRYHKTPGADLSAAAAADTPGGRNRTARYSGLSVSFLTRPLQQDDAAGQDRRWPWRWPFDEVPQLVMQVSAITVPPPALPLRLPRPKVIDLRADQLTAGPGRAGDEPAPLPG
jgi:hypothetical protein